MTGASIALEGVVFRYEDMVMEFHMAIEAGTVLAVIGPSGAGKSTLLSLIAGFDRPERGVVRIGGVDVTAWPPADRPVSMLFQDNNLFSHLSAAANVGLGIRPDLKLAEADRARVSQALARVGLQGFERRLPSEMSGGERQRVALARCLVRDRPVLLLDEPFAALGPALRRDMIGLVRSLHQDMGLTILMVTHNPGDARLAASHTAIVHEGRILALRPTEELLGARDIPELKDYLGV